VEGDLARACDSFHRIYPIKSTWTQKVTPTPRRDSLTHSLTPKLEIQAHRSRHTHRSPSSIDASRTENITEAKTYYYKQHNIIIELIRVVCCSDFDFDTSALQSIFHRIHIASTTMAYRLKVIRYKVSRSILPKLGHCRSSFVASLFPTHHFLLVFYILIPIFLSKEHGLSDFAAK
jgi:hypothetical protein